MAHDNALHQLGSGATAFAPDGAAAFERDLIPVFGALLDQFSAGVVLLGRLREVLAANRSAREIIASGLGVRIVDDRLTLDEPIEARRLVRILDDLLSPEPTRSCGAIQLHDKRGGTSLRMIIVPLGAASDPGERAAGVGIFFHDGGVSAGPDVEALRQVHGLTPAEGRLALEMLNGRTLEEAAYVLGIEQSTGRSHLKRIFEKLDVHRQSEMIRLLLSGVGTLRIDR